MARTRTVPTEVVRVYLIRESERAYLLGEVHGKRNAWFPKSQVTLEGPITIRDSDTVENTAYAHIEQHDATIPTWLLEEKQFEVS
jgi:hypothetical protein